TPLTTESFDDTVFGYGRPYYYFVRASEPTLRPEQQSAASNVILIYPQDIYPPAAPQELNVVAAKEGMVLIWAPNTESDVAGYNIYRSLKAGADYKKVNTDLIRETTFTDPDVKPGVTYYYVITAVDSAPVPNESEKSAEVSEVLKRP